MSDESAPSGYTASQMTSNASGRGAPAPAPSAPAAPAASTSNPQPQQGTQSQGYELPESQALSEGAFASDEPDAQAAGESSEIDPWEESVHGMSARELIAHLKEHGTLPDALLEQLEFEMKDGDEVQRVKLREALDASSQERMQLRDYSRATNKLYLDRQEFQGEVQGFQSVVQRIVANPKTAFEDLRALGMTDEVLDAACRQYAQEQIEFRDLSPSQQRMIQENRETRRQAAALQQEVQRLKSAQQQSQSNQYNTQARAVLTQHFEASFKKYGLNVESPLAVNHFRQHAQNLAGNKPITREVIYKAALATQQEMRALAAQDKAASRPKTGQPLSPSRGAAPLAMPQQRAGNGKGGFTPSQLTAMAKANRH